MPHFFRYFDLSILGDMYQCTRLLLVLKEMSRDEGRGIHMTGKQNAVRFLNVLTSPP